MVSAYRHQEDVDPLVKETLKLVDDPELRKHISTTLPNKGKDVEEICARGFARFDRDFDASIKNCSVNQNRHTGGPHRSSPLLSQRPRSIRLCVKPLLRVSSDGWTRKSEPD